MKIVLVASEVAPFSKTGGLGDVAGSLPEAFARGGHEVSVFSPAYRGIKPGRALASLPVKVGERVETAQVFRKSRAGVTLYFIGNQPFFDRDFLYGAPEGDYPDNLERFVFFDRAVLEALTQLGAQPDIIHCHDWQTGLIPAYLREAYARSSLARARTVFTIHNLGYQGRFPGRLFTLLGLPQEYFTMTGLEFYGDVNLLKAGLAYSDRLTTVSPNYAREIRTPDFGFGLEGVLDFRAKDLTGIVNGIDTGIWDPLTDPALAPGNFDAATIAKRANVKTRLCRELRFADPCLPLLSFIGRLSQQKGVELLVALGQQAARLGVNLAVLGLGEEKYHRLLDKLARQFPGRIALTLKFDDVLARRLYAGSDIFLMPSRYEPCGLGQLIAFRYGAVPLAYRTGGLADTIIDCDRDPQHGDGFLFEDYTAGALLSRIAEALEAYRDKTGWSRIVDNGLKLDFSWTSSAAKYLALFQELLTAAKKT
jgi:starch synthase